MDDLHRSIWRDDVVGGDQGVGRGTERRRMMAARGLVPLPPADQLAVLYQLSLDADSNISNAALTAGRLSDKLPPARSLQPDDDRSARA